MYAKAPVKPMPKPMPKAVEKPAVVPMAPKKLTGPAPVVAKPAQKYYEAPAPKQEIMYGSPMKDGGKITTAKKNSACGDW
jgi:hypothetical protein